MWVYLADVYITLGVTGIMFSSGLTIALLAVAAALWVARNGAPLPGPFKSRNCQGAGWRRAFPAAPKNDIRAFLSVFTDAFAFHVSHRLKFNPNDTILGVYRAQYPHKWLPDAMEIETLAISVERQYGVKLSEVWSDGLTLGELFSMTQPLVQSRGDA